MPWLLALNASLVLQKGPQVREVALDDFYTGYRKSPALEHPSMGAVVSHEFGPRKDLPPYVAVPNPTEYGGTGYLGTQFGPFGIGSDPARSGYEVRDLMLPPGVDDRRFTTRREIRTAVDDHFRQQAGKAEALGAMDEFYQRAYALVSSTAARQAFDISKEPETIRDLYGRHRLGNHACWLGGSLNRAFTLSPSPMAAGTRIKITLPACGRACCRRWIRPMPACCKTWINAVCWKIPWSSGLAILAGRRASILPPGAITGPSRCS